MNSERNSNISLPQTGRLRKKYDLEDRLLEFAATVIDVSEKLPRTRAGTHLAGQFLRAGTSPYGNHGEAQSPESAEDFIHKMKVALKELKETRVSLKLILRNGIAQNIEGLCQENEQLIAIFCKSIETAKRNNNRK